MDPAALAKVYLNAISGNKIDATTLMKLPELVTCNDWAKVEIMGTVHYVSERTKITYNGLLVKHSGGLFYVKNKLMEALGQIDKRFRSVKTVITVIQS